MEQARIVLWMDAVDADGGLLTPSVALQRLKGWGKDPFAATVAASAMCGPVLFDGFGADGQPKGRDDPDAWVRILAVSQEQTKNTMKLFPGLITADARRRFGFQVGKTTLWAMGDTRQAEAITSNPLSAEGGRTTQAIRSEIQNWFSSNGGHDMAGVIEGDAAKRPRSRPARILDIFNAYRPGLDSVAERQREAWEKTQGNPDAATFEERPRYMDFGLMYDSVEAPPEAPLSVDAAPEVVRSVRGDSVWLDADGRILKSILNPMNPPSESRRKWYNQIVAAEDAWLTRQQVDAISDDRLVLASGDAVVLFGDGSKSDDATVIVACRIPDGAVFTVGVWQRPPGARGKGWVVPRGKVDAVVRHCFDEYLVRGFFFDQSHTRDDETQEAFFAGLVDQWHRAYGRKLKVWARGSQRGRDGHAVDFDMAKRVNQVTFIEALPAVEADIDAGVFKFDGDPRMRGHLLNARRIPTKAGPSIGKEHRESKRKIDLAVGLVGARMIRAMYLNQNPRGGGWIA
jgi:hypothetical protein